MLILPKNLREFGDQYFEDVLILTKLFMFTSGTFVKKKSDNMKIFLILFLIFFVSIGFAWIGDTHIRICESAGFTECESAVVPDQLFRDFRNHACRDNTLDCPARIKAEEWRSYGNPAICSHYRSDAGNPAHWKSYGSCHSQFEEKVERRIKSGEVYWNVIQDCGNDTLVFNSDDMTKLIEDVRKNCAYFETSTARMESEQIRKHRFDGYILILIFLLLLIYALYKIS